MNALTRTAAALVLVAATAAAAQAQNYGMPLFTNPHYSTGMRLHADAGQPANAVDAGAVDQTTVQAGLSFTLGRVGLNALAAANLGDIQACDANNVDCTEMYFSVAALAGIRLYGGGRNPLAIGVFGGAGTDITAAEVAGVEGPKQLIIPVGVSVGYKLGPIILWGAPRMNIVKFVNCPSGLDAVCEGSNSDFRWAVGANLPIGPLGLRAAYESGKWGGTTENVNTFGVGISLGIGSQQ
jgi:hypothetical protein